VADIRLITVGSRGDLQPYLAILLALQRRGHAVQLIGSVNFAADAEQHGIPFQPLPGDFRELLRSETGLDLMQGKLVRLIGDELLVPWLETARPAVRGTHLLLVTPLTLWGYHLAESEGCRLAVLSPIPITATGNFGFLRFPATSVPGAHGDLRQRLRRCRNRLSYRLISLLKWRQDSRAIQAFRTQLGLPRLPWGGASSRRDAPQQLADVPILHLFSPQVLEPPADWKASATVTGFCTIEPESGAGASGSAAYSPPADLLAFLDSGSQPFYAGFGSMIPRDPEQLGSIVVEAALQTGERLILSPGWGRVLPRGTLPTSVHLLEDCPHSWLFPRLRGAIHHGGAGTTATTLRSGIPSTVVAFFADQPAWGRTLEQLGVSPATHRVLTVSAAALAGSIRAIADDPLYRARAQRLRDRLAREDGVACTVAALEKLIKEDA
jgi:UDP:flavonoid glycosyltransferase YjiC (YdhE family)